MAIESQTTFLYIAELMEVFNLFDKNQDGSIDVKELGDVMRGMGGNPTDAEIQQMMKEADSKGIA